MVVALPAVEGQEDVFQIRVLAGHVDNGVLRRSLDHRINRARDRAAQVAVGGGHILHPGQVLERFGWRGAVEDDLNLTQRLRLERRDLLYRDKLPLADDPNAVADALDFWQIV